MLVQLAATPAAIFKLFFPSTLEGFKWLETIGAFGAQFEVVRLWSHISNL
jgi:hypothetical protein